ncbi:MAG TPA: hypothetical protein VIG71_02345 [Enteractinococcus sp.]
MTTIGLISFALLAVVFAWSARLNYQERQRLERENTVLKSESDRKAAEYRAAYRDLIGDYERLHAKYKELGGGNDR